RGQRDGGARTVREGAGRSLHVAGADGPPGTSDRPEANGGKPVGIRASRLPDGGAGRDFRLRRRALRRRPAEASGASAGLPPLAANPAAFRPAAAPPAGSRVPTGIGCCRQTSIASLSAKPYNKLVAAGSGTDKPSESEDGMKQRSVLLFLYLFIGLLAGSLAARLLSPVKAVSFLTRALEIAWQPRGDFDFLMYDLTIKVKISLLSLLGLIAAIWLYRRTR